MNSRERRETAVNPNPMGGLTANPAATTARPRNQVATILVPLDGSLHALTALPVARAFAELLHGVVHLVHVAESTLPPRNVLHKLGVGAREASAIVLHQAAGEPAQAIARLASEQQSALIVMCMYTGQARPTGGLGNVGQAILCTAPCPVVLVPPARGHGPLSLRRILLPHDGTPTTATCFGSVLELARRADADLFVIHVVAPGIACPIEPGSVSAPRYVDQAQHEWPAWTRGFLRRAFCPHGIEREVKLHVALAVGNPGLEIVRFARDQQVDLIVLGWHGQMEPARAAVVKAVLSDTALPLLMLRVANPSQPRQ